MKIWDIEGQYQFRQNRIDYKYDKISHIIVFLLKEAMYIINL